MMRKIPIPRTILLSILTLGVYGAIWGYRNAEDLHRDRDGFRHWRLLFWLGFVTVGLTWAVLAVMNFVHLNHLRAAAGVPPHATGTLSIILVWVPVLSWAAAVLWARYWNHSVDILAS